MNKTKPQGGFSDTSRRREEGRRTRPPRSMRTPALGTSDPPPAREPQRPAENVAEWVKQARRLIGLLEESVRLQSGDPRKIAAVERAVAAWDMNGVDEGTVSRVAHLVDRAYVAMHEGPRPHSDKALQGCAHILYNGLPSRIRSTTDFAKVVELVRRLEQEPQVWPAVVKTSAELLGWTGIGVGLAARTIRVALATDPVK